MAPSTPDDSPADATGWSIHGDPTLLVEAARRLRLGIEVGVYRSHPPGEYAMFGVARLLDAVADSMHAGGAVHHTVVSAATEISHHVLTYVLPTAPPGPPVGAPPSACTTCPRPATPAPATRS